jgi:hypothetical protein
MIPEVQRFVARVKPHRDHPRYFEWQTGIACLFIGETDKTKAQELADREIRCRGWERIEFVERATLIEEHVRREGGAVLDAYLKAQAGEPFYVEELDEIAFATKASHPPLMAPRLTESFLDRVVLAAGGERLDTDHTSPNRPKTADYRVGDLVLELKDLQTESLEVRTRQEKLAALFASKLRPDRSVIVDPSILSDSERLVYVDIVGRPVRERLKEASRQVRATLARFATPKIRGGAILLNTGYGSVSADLLFQIAEEYTARSSTLSVAVCISAWAVTNGFDSVCQFAFNPREGGHPDVGRLRCAFWGEIEAMMTEWRRAGFAPPANAADPLRPIVFEAAGGVFTVPAPKPPNSVGKSASDDPIPPAT